MRSSPFLEAPIIIVEQRKESCNCKCNVNFSDPCASCPKNKWGTFYCYEVTEEQTNDELTPTDQSGPKLLQMAQSLGRSSKGWAGSGFKITDPQTLQNRIDSCSKCEFWKKQAFGGTGRCMKCGCSTWAKLRMATEKCPIGRW